MWVYFSFFHFILWCDPTGSSQSTLCYYVGRKRYRVGCSRHLHSFSSVWFFWWSFIDFVCWQLVQRFAFWGFQTYSMSLNYSVATSNYPNPLFSEVYYYIACLFESDYYNALYFVSFSSGRLPYSWILCRA